MRRSELAAYVIGAAVAGTILVFPYTGRALAHRLFPQLLEVTVPFFLLPLFWGLWNSLYARVHPRLGIGSWGALLGVVLAIGVNGLLSAQGQWFPAAMLLPVFIAVLYYFIWAFIVGPLNDALGVDRP